MVIVHLLHLHCHHVSLAYDHSGAGRLTECQGLSGD